MQKYTEISQDEGLLDSLAMILDNDKTALSCSSGTAFPTVNVQIGQLCFRTDENRLYQTKDGINWIEIADLSSSLTQQKSDILSATVAKKEVNKFTILREGFSRFENHSSAATGTIAIRLPVRRNTSMLTLKLRGFNYTANKSTWDLDIGGYLYTTGWYNTSAFSKSALPWGTTVRFADDGTYAYVLLGTTTTVWSYPRIWLDEVMVSYSQNGDIADPSKYYITLLTDETGFSVESTVTVNAGTSAVAVDDGVYLSTAQTISGAKTFSAVTKVTNATDATSATTGGLVVSGGVGIGKQLRAGGAVTFGSTLAVSGKSTFTGQTVHNGGISATTGTFNTTTDSTSTVTGALQTKGGLGVAKSAFIGLNADVGGDLQVAGKAIVGGSVAATGAIKSADETDATSTTTGAFIVSGGLGVAKSAYIGGNANIAGALDVTGKVTATGGFAGNLVGNVTGDLTGNAATATKLVTARTINGVAFDGSANITIADSTKLPLTGGTMSGSLRIEGAAGTNPLQTRGIQGIENGATTAGLYLNYVDQTVKTYFNGETHYIQGGVYTGNAATATKLQTARTINGVAFDGTTNITVVDSTKLPTAGGTITGALTVNGLLTANGGFKGRYVATDSRALTPSATPKGAFGAYFTSQGGMTGTANTVYGDLLALNSYGDTSGGLANALFFAKGSKSIFHYQAAQGATTWGAASQLAYVTDNVASATKLATARTINGVAFDGSANITIADSTKLPLAGGTVTGALTVNGLITAGASGIRTAKIDSTSAVSVLNGGSAQSIYTGGVLVSNAYADSTKIPTNGIYSKGKVHTATSVEVGSSGDGVKDTDYVRATIHPPTHTGGDWEHAVRDDATYAYYKLKYGTSGHLQLRNDGVLSASGGFDGNASTATKLATARTIALSGAATGTATSFDGSADISIAVTSLDAAKLSGTASISTTGNAATATKLATARTINGVSFDGSGNITIGEPTFANPLATYASGDANALNTDGFNVRYLNQTATNKPLGTDHAVMTLNYSAIWSSQQAFDWRTGDVFTRTQNNGTWLDWATQVDTRNYAKTIPTFSVNGAGLVPARVGSTTTKFLREDGTWVVPTNTTYAAMTEANAIAGTERTARLITAAILKSAIQTHAPTPTSVTGNAGTATKLATACTINGTSFDGTANITTANWGTERTLTIGSTGKSVNGSADVSWTLAEIGAAAASHTHDYLSTSGGTLSGDLSVTGAITATGNITAYSDKRIKEDVAVIESALTKVEQLNGVTFKRKDTLDRQTGLLAQEVEAVLPEAVTRQEASKEIKAITGDEEVLAVNYGALAGLLVESIKELNGKLKAQQELIDKQAKLIENLLYKVSHA